MGETSLCLDRLQSLLEGTSADDMLFVSPQRGRGVKPRPETVVNAQCKELSGFRDQD
ncbi:hypothetical protein I79_026131 [Cricetulus griseus]|uniref:Uncharacterized protein n=1 Tax=Cricetulus griseus TaxID=10029 RepID=G3IQ42_CRIGR|nr:hypothetical protein I79_026131 [Cricetulus griseus]